MEEKEKEENIWRRKYSDFGGEEERSRKRGNIFGEGKHSFFIAEKKKGEGRGGKYLEKEKGENIRRWKK